MEFPPEVGETNARWEQFEKSDFDGKVELFTETLTAGQLDASEAFEMLTSIREEMDTAHNSQSRIRYAELVGRLRDEAPELYQQDVPYYHSNLIDDAITDMRWEAIPELLSPFAVDPENGRDTFFNIMDCVLTEQRRDENDRFIFWPVELRKYADFVKTSTHKNVRSKMLLNVWLTLSTRRK